MTFTPLSVFTLNTFLVPSLFNHKKSATNQYLRAARINHYVSQENPHHLCIFQEVWGSGLSLFLPSSHAPTSDYLPFVTFSPFLDSVLNSAKIFWNQLGGLLITHRQPLSLSWFTRKRFTVSATSSNKGTLSCLYHMRHLWSEQDYLLVLNTHLDAVHQENKMAQLQEIRKELDSAVPQAIQFIQQNHPQLSQPSSHLYVMVAGDFNIPSHEDPSWKHRISPHLRDPYYDHHQEEIPTYDKANSLVEYPRVHARIDYVFFIDQWENTQLGRLSCLRYDIIKQELGQELSDHWGSSLSILPERHSISQ